MSILPTVAVEGIEPFGQGLFDPCDITERTGYRPARLVLILDTSGLKHSRFLSWTPQPVKLCIRETVFSY